MKLRKIVLLLPLLLISCTSTSSEVSNVSSNTDSAISPTLNYDVSSLKETYGDFSISGTDYVYDESTNTYTISVGTTKKSYTLKGYFDGHIIIDNGNNLDEDNYKGVTLNLAGVCFSNNDSSPSIYYSLNKKNVELKITNDNYIINQGTGDALLSNNNLEIHGSGNLNLYTQKGHTIKSEGDITLYGSLGIEITSGHDGIHGEAIYTYSDSSSFSGTVDIVSAYSQAIEATNASYAGLIDITGGTFNIHNAESVFKSDYQISVASTVIADGIWSDPIVKQDSTVKTLSLIVTGSLLVNGTNISSQTY